MQHYTRELFFASTPHFDLRTGIANHPLSDAGGQYPRYGVPVGGGAVKDAVAALVSLGYKPPEASRLISKIKTEGCDSETIIRAALKQAVSK